MKTNWPVLRRAGILTVSLALCGSVAGAQTAASDHAGQVIPVRASAASSAALITRVDVGRTGAQTTVRVEGNALLVYQAEHLKNPERLVLDFSGARLATSQAPATNDFQPVGRIRLAQFKPDVARVVLDLTGSVPYSVRAEGHAILITFAAIPGATFASTAPVAQVPKPEKPAAEAARSQAAARTEKGHQAAAALTSRLPLPEMLTQQTAALASPRPQTPSEPNQAPAQDQPKAQPQNPPQQQQHVQPAAASPSGQKYTGEPISVNFKDLDLKDFFRLIHEISGLNVVLDPSVRGSLPALVLDEVPWDQALDIVLKNNSLDKELEGNVLRIVTQDTRKKEIDMTKDLEKAQAEAVPAVTVTRVLSYTKSSVLRDTLKRWLSARGEIMSDDRTNSLIIRDIPSVLPDIDNLIRQLDRKSQQVEIEARVVAASRSFSRDIGTQFGFSAQGLNGRNTFGGVPVVGVSPILHGGASPIPPLIGSPAPASTGTSGGTGLNPPVPMPLNSSLAAGSPTSGIAFQHSSPNFALDYMITAAEAKGVGKLLSKPKVYTQNNEKGTVKQGNRVPIQTTINNTISVQYVDAVLSLEVTPQITADGTIFLQVKVENTQIDNGIPRVQGIPALDTQSVDTNVLVNDGGTVVIGGITVTSQRTDINQVPIFGSIPVIGNLFKRTNVNVSSQDLWFFLTPRVIPN